MVIPIMGIRKVVSLVVVITEWALLKGTARAFPLWTARQSITLKEEIDYEKTSYLG